MGQQSLIYSFVARGTVVLAEYTEFTGNFTSVAAQCLQKLPSSSNKFTYSCDGHTFNYLVDDGFVYCVVAVESLGRQVPIAFLERIKDVFTKKYGGGKAAIATAHSLNKEFGPKQKEQMQYCVDHPEEISKIAKVKAQVTEVKGVMMENIEKVLDRGEKIELLVDKTETLRSQKKQMGSRPPPKIIGQKDEMRNWSRAVRSQGKRIALVPTMGFLHEGHLSLIRQARQQADVVVVSIYVNPAQFSASEDLLTYPSDFAGDLGKIMSVALGGGADAVFNPKNLYDYGGGGGEVAEEGGNGNRHESWIRVENLEKGLCGRSRPLCFRGVATVIAKLFHVVEPDVAFFGKKDYQQWRIIQRMVILDRPMWVDVCASFCWLQVRDLDFVVEVIGSEIIREEDGLAMSSRNVYLSPEERQKALSIYRSLSAAKSAVEAKEGQVSCGELKDSVVQSIQDAGGNLDYVEIVDQESLKPVAKIERPVVFCVAAWFGKARLIDNMEIDLS